MSKKAKEKAQVEKPKEIKNVRIEKTSGAERRIKSPLVDTEIELKSENWAKSATLKFSFDILDKNRDYTPDYA